MEAVKAMELGFEVWVGFQHSSSSSSQGMKMRCQSWGSSRPFWMARPQKQVGLC